MSNTSDILEFTGEHFFLSNFSPHSVGLSFDRFPTAEHAFQASKFLHMLEAYDDIRYASTPGQAKRLGRKYRLSPYEVVLWDLRKDGVMYSVIKAKFVQQSRLSRKLVATEDRLLVEGNRHGDTYWGVSGGQGLNRLGELLMRLRTELKLTN
jgi:ribA/ribD-fused uncharacterized protein